VTIEPANPLLGPGEPELTCDECFEGLDAYVDQVLADERADQRIPGMRAHLAGCPACREDYESLLEFTRRQSG
jgi:anti-sigma factor RsiW